MVNAQEARPARRPQGSLSARQWQDIRQAARLARSEGVEVSRFGFTIRPAAFRRSVGGSATTSRPLTTAAFTPSFALAAQRGIGGL